MALCGWTARALAINAGVSVGYINKQNSDRLGRLEGRAETVDKIMAAFSRAGLVFAHGGVHRRQRKA